MVGEIRTQINFGVAVKTTARIFYHQKLPEMIIYLNVSYI